MNRRILVLLFYAAIITNSVAANKNHCSTIVYQDQYQKFSLGDLCAAISQNNKPVYNLIFDRCNKQRSKISFANLHVNEQRQSLLHYAVLSSCATPEVIQEIIDGGALVSAVDIHGQTPLHHAAYYGKQAIMLTLVYNGAKIDQPDICGVTPADLYRQTPEITTNINRELDLNLLSNIQRTLAKQ